MPVYVDDINFTDEFTVSGDSPVLMGAISDLINVTIYCSVSWQSIDVPVNFAASTRTITRTDVISTWIQDGFKKGDSIVIINAGSNNGNYNIVNVTPTVLTVLQSVTNASASAAHVYGTTPIQSLDFYYNICANNGQKTFVSPTDNESIQRFTGTVNEVYYDATFNLQPNSTSLAWWDKSVNGVDMFPIVTALGTTADYKQQFKIEFSFLVKPFFQSGQLQQLKNILAQQIGSALNKVDFIPPNSFLTDSVGFLYQIDAKFAITNTKPDHTSGQKFDFGNTSYFNSFFPSGVSFGGNVLTNTQYEFVSIDYSVSGNAVDSIDFKKVTDCTLVFKCLDGVTTEMPYVLNFMWLPNSIASYQGYGEKNQKSFRECFLYDRCKTVDGGPSAIGDEYGTSIQALKNVSSTSSIGIVTVNFQVDLGTLSKSTFTNANESDRNYMICVTPQNPNCTNILDSNRSAIIGDVNSAFTNTDDSTLLTIIGNDVHFKTEFNQSNKTDLKGFLGQYGFAKCEFKVKPNCIIEDINCSFEVQVTDSILYPVTVATFPIQEWNNATKQYWNGTFNDLNFSIENNFDLPSSSFNDNVNARSLSTVKRNDFHDYKQTLIYGFQLGYQFWQNVSQASKEFIEYHTNYWPVYSQGYVGNQLDQTQGKYLIGDFFTSVKFKIVWNVRDTSTNIVTQFVRYCDVSVSDEASNISNSGITKTRDLSGKDLNGEILTNNATIVSSLYEFQDSIDPDSVSGELVLYYENGNQIVFDRITTDANSTIEGSAWVETQLISVPTNTQVLLYAALDLSKLDFTPTNVRIYSYLKYNPMYKIYRALISQSGTDAPIVVSNGSGSNTPLENTISDSISYGYSSPTVYFIQAPTGTFPQDKTTLRLTPFSETGDPGDGKAGIVWAGTDTINILTTGSGVLNYAYVEIMVKI